MRIITHQIAQPDGSRLNALEVIALYKVERLQPPSVKQVLCNKVYSVQLIQLSVWHVFSIQKTVGAVVKRKSLRNVHCFSVLTVNLNSKVLFSWH